MTGETLYLGTYKHVSAVTFQRPKPTSSSWTQPPTAYEDVAEAVLWRVMGEEEGDGALTLLSEYAIDSRRFHSTDYWLDYDYAKSEIRAWLNGPFLTEAFSTTERNSIVTTTVVQNMWDPEMNGWADGPFTAIWGRSDPAAHTTDFPKIAYGDKVYLPWREYKSNVFHWDAGNKSIHAYIISSEAAEVRLRNQKKETDTGNDIRALSRSPMPESSNHVMPASDSVYSDGNYTVSCYGIRPIVKLDPGQVLYTEKLDGGAYRLTLLNEEIQLVSITTGGKPLPNGTKMALAYMGDMSIEAVASNHEGLAYKAVREVDGKREIAAYGAADGDRFDITSLTEGEYTVYIWAQRNAAIGAEGSEPIFFSLTVDEDKTKKDAQDGRSEKSSQGDQASQNSQNSKDSQNIPYGLDSRTGSIKFGIPLPARLDSRSISIAVIALGLAATILLKR
jgi:hypothetical protein